MTHTQGRIGIGELLALLVVLSLLALVPYPAQAATIASGTLWGKYTQPAIGPEMATFVAQGCATDANIQTGGEAVINLAPYAGKTIRLTMTGATVGDLTNLRLVVGSSPTCSVRMPEQKAVAVGPPAGNRTATFTATGIRYIVLAVGTSPVGFGINYTLVSL